MFLKRRINLILSLCLIALTSVGFSSWVITINSATVTGTIETDYVINSQEYVYLDKSKGDDNTGIEMFKYRTFGFVTNEPDTNDNFNINYTSKGYIIAHYIIDFNKCKEIFSTENDLNIEFELKYESSIKSSFNIFKDDGVSRQLKHSIKFENSVVSFVTDSTANSDQIDNFSYVFSVSISNWSSLSNEKFDLTYEFFAQVGDYFKNNVYSYLYGDNIKFSLKTLIRSK